MGSLLGHAEETVSHWSCFLKSTRPGKKCKKVGVGLLPLSVMPFSSRLLAVQFPPRFDAFKLPRSPRIILLDPPVLLCQANTRTLFACSHDTEDTGTSSISVQARTKPRHISRNGLPSSRVDRRAFSRATAWAGVDSKGFGPGALAIR